MRGRVVVAPGWMTKGYACTVGGRFGILVRVAGGEGVQEGGFLRVGEELQLVLFVEAREGEVSVVFGVGQVRGGGVGEVQGACVKMLPDLPVS